MRTFYNFFLNIFYFWMLQCDEISLFSFHSLIHFYFFNSALYTTSFSLFILLFLQFFIFMFFSFRPVIKVGDVFDMLKNVQHHCFPIGTVIYLFVRYFFATSLFNCKIFEIMTTCNIFLRYFFLLPNSSFIYSFYYNILQFFLLS